MVQAASACLGCGVNDLRERGTARRMGMPATSTLVKAMGGISPLNKHVIDKPVVALVVKIRRHSVRKF